MKPQIRLIDGLHLTATDKRNLLAVIEFERASPPEVWGTRWLGLPKSPKSYAVLPDPEKPGRYSAVIKTRERNDRGEPKIRQSTVVFVAENVEPLPHPDYQTQDLFAPKPWEIEVYEQGVAPSAETILYDGAGLADYPDFWDNVGEAAVTMVEFGLYHPSMDLPELGKEVGDEYRKRKGVEPNRLIFQAADSLFLIANAIEAAGSTDPDAMIDALQKTDWTGTRGEITFNHEKGNTFQQWLGVPYVTYQLTEEGQSVADAPLLEAPGMELDPSRLMRP